MYRSLKLSQTLARAVVCLQPHQTWPARHLLRREDTSVRPCLQGRWMSGEGEGRGGGGGGSIRSAGGSFGKREVAEEERYFREESAHQIKELKKVMTETLSAKLLHHQKELDIHKECLMKHQEQFAKDGNAELHHWHINHHETSIKYEQEEIDKIKDMWKRFHLD